MNKKLIIIFIALLVTSISSRADPTTVNNADQQSTGFMPDFAPYCGCGFSTSAKKDYKHPPFILWEFHGNGQLRVGNQFLPLVNVKEEMGKKPGDNAYFEFTNKSLNIDIKGHCKLIDHCPDDGKCFDIRYKGTVEMTQKGKTSKFPVWGDCGC